MAKAPTTTKKRRLRQSGTIREEQAKASAAVPSKPKRRPFRRIFSVILWPFRWVAGWKIWQAKAFAPIRFVGRILAKILFVSYIRSSWQELKKVTWPSFRQGWRLTFAVLIFALFFGIIVAIVDYGLDKIFRKVILNA